MVTRPPNDDKASTVILRKEQERLLAAHLYHLPTSLRAAENAYTNIYINDFNALIQGMEKDQMHATRHLFYMMHRIFWPNDPADGHWQEPNSIKTNKRGDAYWSTLNRVLGCIFDTIAQMLMFPNSRELKIAKNLAHFPR